MRQSPAEPEAEERGALPPFLLFLRGFSLVEVLCCLMIMSSLCGGMLLCVHSESWQIRCAKNECVRLNQWLTVRYHRSIINNRYFSLTVAGGGILTSQIALNWYNPLVKESFVLKNCFLCRLGAYRLARYSPLYHTLSPGMTLNVLKDKNSVPWGKLVLPVKGVPRLEWYCH